MEEVNLEHMVGGNNELILRSVMREKKLKNLGFQLIETDDNEFYWLKKDNFVVTYAMMGGGERDFRFYSLIIK